MIIRRVLVRIRSLSRGGILQCILALRVCKTFRTTTYPMLGPLESRADTREINLRIPCFQPMTLRKEEWEWLEGLKILPHRDPFLLVITNETRQISVLPPSKSDCVFQMQPYQQQEQVRTGKFDRHFQPNKYRMIPFYYQSNVEMLRKLPEHRQSKSTFGRRLIIISHPMNRKLTPWLVRIA